MLDVRIHILFRACNKKLQFAVFCILLAAIEKAVILVVPPLNFKMFFVTMSDNADRPLCHHLSSLLYRHHFYRAPCRTVFLPVDGLKAPHSHIIRLALSQASDRSAHGRVLCDRYSLMPAQEILIRAVFTVTGTNVVNLSR